MCSQQESGEDHHGRFEIHSFLSGWARLILNRRRDLINDRPNCATAAEAPLDVAQERYHFDNLTAHTSGAYQQSEAA